jgi:hypothetical protein
MKKVVTIHSYGRFVGYGTIIRDQVPSGIDSLSCYEVAVDSLLCPALFYKKPELRTGKHFNVGNKAFWMLMNHGKALFPRIE